MNHSSIKMAPIEIDELVHKQIGKEPILNGLFRTKTPIYRELLPES